RAAPRDASIRRLDETRLESRRRRGSRGELQNGPRTGRTGATGGRKDEGLDARCRRCSGAVPLRVEFMGRAGRHSGQEARGREAVRGETRPEGTPREAKAEAEAEGWSEQALGRLRPRLRGASGDSQGQGQVEGRSPGQARPAPEEQGRQAAGPARDEG